MSSNEYKKNSTRCFVLCGSECLNQEEWFQPMIFRWRRDRVIIPMYQEHKTLYQNQFFFFLNSFSTVNRLYDFVWNSSKGSSLLLLLIMFFFRQSWVEIDRFDKDNGDVRKISNSLPKWCQIASGLSKAGDENMGWAYITVFRTTSECFEEYWMSTNPRMFRRVLEATVMTIEFVVREKMQQIHGHELFCSCSGSYFFSGVAIDPHKLPEGFHHARFVVWKK